MAAIELPEVIDIAAVGELRARLDGALAGPAVLLDGAGVRRCDTAGAQLLAAFIVEARRRQLPVSFAAPSAALLAAARLLGLAAALGLDDGAGPR